MRTVQADGCLNSEQIHTLFISGGGGQEGGWGGGRFLSEAQNLQGRWSILHVMLTLSRVSGTESNSITRCRRPLSRVGQNHIYTVHIRYFWQGITKHTGIYGVFIRL